MHRYLLDASVTAYFFRPKSAWGRHQDIYNLYYQLKAKLISEVIAKKSVVFIPSFCISEVKNTLAKWCYRYQEISLAQLKTGHGLFLDCVQDRKYFYSYDLNRYHNINSDIIIPIEHTTNTEFQDSGLPIDSLQVDIDKALKIIDPYDSIGKHYLSTFDILILSMGIELKNIHGTEINLLTCDKRLILMCQQKPDIFPKAFNCNWFEIERTLKKLP